MAKRREPFSSLRKKKGTQSKVASDLGISTVYLRMIENGTFKPGRDLLFRLANYFEVDVYILFPEYQKSKHLSEAIS